MQAGMRELLSTLDGSRAARIAMLAGMTREELDLVMVRVTLHVHGRQPVTELAAALSELEHVDPVLASDANAMSGILTWWPASPPIRSLS
jgi:hypothetical protein